MPDIQGVTQFTSPSGRKFVYLTDATPLRGEVLFSDDGITYFQIGWEGFEGSADDHRMSFMNPRQPQLGSFEHLERRGDNIFYDDERFVPEPVSFDARLVVPLSAIRVTAFFCRSRGGRHYLVRTSAYDYLSPDATQVFVGTGRLRGVGTGRVLTKGDRGVNIETPVGTFSAVDLQGPEPKAYWDNRPLAWLDPADYLILELSGWEATMIKR